jgi:hypothetical protein
MVAELKGHQSVPEIDDDEYGNIYVVTRPRFGKVKTLRFQYGVSWPMSHALMRSRVNADLQTPVLALAQRSDRGPVVTCPDVRQRIGFNAAVSR